jgi:hypothetical protein
LQEIPPSPLNPDGIKYEGCVVKLSDWLIFIEENGIEETLIGAFQKTNIADERNFKTESIYFV